jgi:hypothetical protein
MNSLERAEQICQKLAAAGIRATVDVSALNPPAVLVGLPSDRVNDVNCGVSVTWAIDAISASPNSFDRNVWAQLDEMVAAVEAVLPIERSHAQPWQRPGLGTVTNYVSYRMSFTEAI